VGAARILRTSCAAYGSASVRESDVGPATVQRNSERYRISDPASAPTGERLKAHNTGQGHGTEIRTDAVMPTDV
jgi:hypothetical protein